MRTFDHIPIKTVRFWAWLDTSVTYMPAIPPLSLKFIAAIYWINGLLGGVATAPVFEPIHIVFVSLMGSLIAIWCAARLLTPTPIMAVIDGWGRLWIGLTFIYIMLALDGPPLLWCFVFTQWAGAFAQLREAYFPKSV